MTKDEALKMAIEEQIEWIDGWAKAYPESIFPPVTEEESQALEEFKKHLGMRIAAQMGRHIGKRFEEVIETLNACKEALAENETSSLEIVGFIEGSNLSTNEPDFVGFLYKTQRYGQTPVYKLVNTFEESANG